MVLLPSRKHNYLYKTHRRRKITSPQHDKKKNLRRCETLIVYLRSSIDDSYVTI